MIWVDDSLCTPVGRWIDLLSFLVWLGIVPLMLNRR